MYLALIRSSLEYSSVVWDPHLQKDIEKLEKIQRQAARFITGDYSSRDQGCVTRMLKDLAIPLLQDRRKANRLVFFYKVVEGQVPALTCHDYLTQIRNKRQIKSKQFTDCITQNIIDKQSTNNSKCFKPIQCNSVLFRNSLFPRTVIDWNHLEDSVVCKDSKQLQESCFSLGLNSHPSSLSRCSYAERPCNVFIQIQIQIQGKG